MSVKTNMERSHEIICNYASTIGCARLLLINHNLYIGMESKIILIAKHILYCVSVLRVELKVICMQINLWNNLMQDLEDFFLELQARPPQWHLHLDLVIAWPTANKTSYPQRCFNDNSCIDQCRKKYDLFFSSTMKVFLQFRRIMYTDASNH